MDKTVYSGTILICTTLIIGSVWFPDNAAMWLASTAPLMNITRVIIVGLMLGLVFTDPPRRRAFRTLLAATATVLLGAAVWRALSGSVLLIDALLFLVAAISFALAALEGQPLPKPATIPKMARTYLQGGYLLANKQSEYAVSDTSGMLWPRRSADLFGRALIIISVVTGALYQNVRPYRMLWKGD